MFGFYPFTGDNRFFRLPLYYLRKKKPLSLQFFYVFTLKFIIFFTLLPYVFFFHIIRIQAEKSYEYVYYEKNILRVKVYKKNYKLKGKNAKKKW